MTILSGGSDFVSPMGVAALDNIVFWTEMGDKDLRWFNMSNSSQEVGVVIGGRKNLQRITLFHRELAKPGLNNFFFLFSPYPSSPLTVPVSLSFSTLPLLFPTLPPSLSLLYLSLFLLIPVLNFLLLSSSLSLSLISFFFPHSVSSLLG